MDASLRIGVAALALLGAACFGKVAPELATPAPSEESTSDAGAAAPPDAAQAVAPACDGLGGVVDLAPPADPWAELSATLVNGFAVDHGVVYFGALRDFSSSGDEAAGLYMQSIADPSTPPVAIIPETRGGDGSQLAYTWVGVRGSDLYYAVGDPSQLYVRDLGSGESMPLVDPIGLYDFDAHLVTPGGLVWAVANDTTWAIDFFDATTRAITVLATGPAGTYGPYPDRLRYAGDTLYFTFADAFEALPLAGGTPRVVRKVDPASVLWLGRAWLLGADERGLYACDYWAKKKFGPVTCKLTVTAPDGSFAGYLVDPAAGFQNYLYDADLFATDDRYAYWTQLDDDNLATDEAQPANAFVRVPKAGGTPCVIDDRHVRQFVVDDTRVAYVTGNGLGIATRRK